MAILYHLLSFTTTFLKFAPHKMKKGDLKRICKKYFIHKIIYNNFVDKVVNNILTAEN
jgi:hypothetical protein